MNLDVSVQNPRCNFFDGPISAATSLFLTGLMGTLWVNIRVEGKSAHVPKDFRLLSTLSQSRSLVVFTRAVFVSEVISWVYDRIMANILEANLGYKTVMIPSEEHG